MWRRLIHSKAIIMVVFMAIFSLGILGQIDTRMHIGGSDWDLGDLIYINIDEYLIDDFTAYDAAQQQPLEGSAEDFLEKAEAATPGKKVEESAQSEELVEPVKESVPAAAKEEMAPPATTPPKVEEKKEEKPTIFVHRVHPGETLWDIANAYGITIDTILSANDLRDPNRIAVGQELEILSVQGVLHRVAAGESLWEIAERYEIPMDDISKANSIPDPSRLKPNERIVIPGATRLKPRDVLVVNGQLQKAFDWPTRGRISSPFGPRWGRMHNGLDIAVPTGTPIRAAADGRVTFADWNGGYGILVVVDHGNSVETRYAHNSRLNVKVGQKVERGDVVSYSGNTGVSTGPHLHFEIRHHNTPLNPQQYLK